LLGVGELRFQVLARALQFGELRGILRLGRLQLLLVLRIEVGDSLLVGRSGHTGGAENRAGEPVQWGSGHAQPYHARAWAEKGFCGLAPVNDLVDSVNYREQAPRMARGSESPVELDACVEGIRRFNRFYTRK